MILLPSTSVVQLAIRDSGVVVVLHCDVLVITLYVINCCSSIMDASNGCQDLFTDMDYMSCPSCIALQQVILCLYGT